jgi:hypothetical protein
MSYGQLLSVKPTELVKPRNLGAATVMEAESAVAQFVETLRYKPKRYGSDSRWSHWDFSLN